MKRAEAIEWLEHHIAITGYDKDDDLLKALKFAVRELKANRKSLRPQTHSKSSGAYECFHCGKTAVVWDNDFSFEDFGYEGEGIVHVCHCANCGAEIEYWIPTEGVE